MTTRCELIQRWLLAMQDYCASKIRLAVRSRGGRIDLNLDKSMEIFSHPFGDRGDDLLVKSIEEEVLYGTILSLDGSEKPGALELSMLGPAEMFQLYQTLYEKEGFAEIFDQNDHAVDLNFPKDMPQLGFAWLPLLVDGRKLLLLLPKI